MLSLRPQPRYRERPTPSAGVRPRCLGLTGGIGSGKTAALDAFRALGAEVLSSDQIVDDLYYDPEVVDRIADRFGRELVDVDGSIDRGRLAQHVFGDSDGLRFLEDLLHPRIGQAREAWQAAQRSRRPAPPLLVCEVPLLFEVGMEDQFDAVLVVTASEDVRRQRVEARGQDFDARRAQQLSEDVKVARADGAYVNDGSRDDLQSWVASCFRQYAT